MAKTKKTVAGKLTFEMEKEKETKGAVRYGDGESHNLYFRKEELTKEFGEFPESITVTVEAS